MIRTRNQAEMSFSQVACSNVPHSDGVIMVSLFVNPVCLEQPRCSNQSCCEVEPPVKGRAVNAGDSEDRASCFAALKSPAA